MAPLHGKWGEAFGVPFAFEGLFFFTEGIFVAIYIFGWRRLKPWAHFWTGVPIVLAGIFGSISVVSANAWMNAPAGFTLDANGNVIEVDPVRVIFNDSMPWQAATCLLPPTWSAGWSPRFMPPGCCEVAVIVTTSAS